MIVDLSAMPRATAIDTIVRLEQQLFGAGAWTRGMVGQELDAPARTYVFDVDDADPSMVRGYAGYWYDGDDAELMTIGTDPRYQRTGVATRLLDELMARSRAQGARRMLLEVRVDNMPAISLYEHAGFSRLGVRRRYYQPEGVDAYTMSVDFQARPVGFMPAKPGPSTSNDHSLEQS